MKRLVALILVMILCLSATLTLAESKDGITFRNIPWESSIEDAISVLKKEFGKNITYDSQFEETKVGEHYYYVIHYSFQIPSLKVAGFPVKGTYGDTNLELYFIPNLDDSQTAFSRESGRLIGAKYPYIYSDKMSFDSLNAELEKKLNGIYGSAEKLYAKDNYWKRKWTKDDAYILGDTEEKANKYSKGIVTITTYDPDGCSLFYAYLPKSIENELSTIIEIDRRERQEQWEKEQKEKEEQKQKEEDERGTDGL